MGVSALCDSVLKEQLAQALRKEASQKLQLPAHRSILQKARALEATQGSEICQDLILSLQKAVVGFLQLMNILRQARNPQNSWHSRNDSPHPELPAAPYLFMSMKGNFYAVMRSCDSMELA